MPNSTGTKVQSRDATVTPTLSRFTSDMSSFQPNSTQLRETAILHHKTL